MQPKRAGNSPKLYNSEIKVNEIIGRGQKGDASSVVHSVEIIEKERPNRRFFAVMKRIPYLGNVRSEVYRGQIAYRAFKRAGLPVPSFSRVSSKKYSKYYNDVFMEDVRKRVGKIEDGHIMGYPKFLRRLDIKRDNKLIKDLAKDLVTIHNLGFSTKVIDFWHFYKTKNGSYNRIIVDFNGFYKSNSNFINRSRAKRNFDHIHRQMSQACYELFVDEYFKHYNGNSKDSIEKFARKKCSN